MKRFYHLRCVVLVITILMYITTFADTSTATVVINGTTTKMPSSLSLSEGFVPLKWIAQKMGAMRVTWDNKEVTIEIPDFLMMHQYVNYLSGLQNEGEEVYPLPARLQALDLPDATFESHEPVIMHKPLTINIVSGEYVMPWAIYDYKIIKDTLYVDYRWLNTLFLADLQYDRVTNTLNIAYMTSEELHKKIAELEKITMPTTPHEALALWIRGQQTRSGALQYSALSPQLKEEALARVNKEGWVTGGSSPSLGKAIILEIKKVDDCTMSYTVQYDEILTGQLYNQFSQTITVQRQLGSDLDNWFVISVQPNDSYYSVLQ